MIRSHTRWLLALLAVSAMLAVGCGQKPDVAQVASGGGFAAGDAEDLGGGAASGVPGDAADGGAFSTTDGGATGGSSGGGGTADGTTAGGGDGGAGAATGGAAGGGGSGGPGDRTGITDKEIVIGIHAPVTGAAPFPQNSFERGKDIYFQLINEKGGIHNRRVRVVFRDDKFDPRSAVAACREMVEGDKVFMLVGGGGSDQIGACATYANSVGVPYLSAGVQTRGLDQLRGYFAASLTYAQQAPLLAQMIAKQLSGQKVALVVAEGENLDDYFAAQSSALGKAGIKPVYAERIPKTTSQSDALNIATELRSSGAQVVVFNASPVSFLNIAAAGAGQGYRPRYVGPGVTNGLNTVATVGCGAARSVDGARFFSPFPQLDLIDRLDPSFRPAYRKYAGAEPDDLGIALWGLDKLIGTMLDAAGPDVSRQSFVALLESGRPFETGVFPPVRYSADNHFGGSSVHVLEARCSDSAFHTIGTFVGGF